MAARESLEKEIADAFITDEQLNSIVRAILQQPLNHFVAPANLPTMITGLMNELEKDQDKLTKFVTHLMVRGPNLEIRGSAKAYIDEKLGIKIEEKDPYKALIVLGQPFADRQSFRDKLKDLLASEYYRTLVANGPRYCGRSHSRILVRYVGREIGIRVVVVDLLKSDISEIIAYLINEMQLDVKDTRDRMAQFSTQTKGFLSALRGVAQNEFQQKKIRWCIVFDHHDLAETPPERKEFAELMIQELMEDTLPNIWVVMLGMGTCQFLPPKYVANILNVDLLRIGETDIETYINELRIHKNEAPLEGPALAAAREKVLADLTLPLETIESMDTMSFRLREYL